MVATFDTITTKKSFSLILSDPTVAVSLRILPAGQLIHHSLDAIVSRRSDQLLTGVNKLLVFGRESLGLLDLLLDIPNLMYQLPPHRRQPRQGQREGKSTTNRLGILCIYREELIVSCALSLQ